MTDKQQRFVEEYLIDLNGTQAAIRAGYSEKTAPEQASRLLRNVKVASAIKEAKTARSERTQVAQDNVVCELARIAFSDLRKMMTSGGALLDPQDWDDDTAAAIASVEVVTTYTGETDENGNKVPEYTKKIKTWDKNSALEKLCKHLGMFTEKVDVTQTIISAKPLTPEEWAAQHADGAA
ncbi:MAG: terminase small subunit [Paracoccaceae bacterium]